MSLRRWAFLLLLISAPAGAAAPRFGEPVVLVAGHRQAGFAIAANDERLFIAWTDYAGDDGTKHDLWFTSLKLDGSDARTQPLMRQDSLSLNNAIAVQGDTVGVAWTETGKPGTDDTLFFQRSVDGGKTWEPRKDMGIRDLFHQTETHPGLAADAEHYYLVYLSFGKVYLLRSPNLGNTWEDARVIGEADNEYADGVEVVAGSGGIAVAYVLNDRVAVRSSVDAGETWSNPVFVTPPGVQAFGQSIATNGDRLLVSWWQHQPNLKPTNGRVFARVSTDNGASFKPVRRVSGPIPASGFGPPEVTVALGRFTTAWRDRDDATRLAYSPRGLAWVDRTKLPGTAYRHAVAGTASHLWVAYADGDDINGVHASE